MEIIGPTGTPVTYVVVVIKAQILKPESLDLAPLSAMYYIHDFEQIFSPSFLANKMEIIISTSLGYCED